MAERKLHVVIEIETGTSLKQARQEIRREVLYAMARRQPTMFKYRRVVSVRPANSQGPAK